MVTLVQGLQSEARNQKASELVLRGLKFDRKSKHVHASDAHNLRFHNAHRSQCVRTPSASARASGPERTHRGSRAAHLSTMLQRDTSVERSRLPECSARASSSALAAMDAHRVGRWGAIHTRVFTVLTSTAPAALLLRAGWVVGEYEISSDLNSAACDDRGPECRMHKEGKPGLQDVGVSVMRKISWEQMLTSLRGEMNVLAGQFAHNDAPLVNRISMNLKAGCMQALQGIRARNCTERGGQVLSLDYADSRSTALARNGESVRKESVDGWGPSRTTKASRLGLGAMKVLRSWHPGERNRHRRHDIEAPPYHPCVAKDGNARRVPCMRRREGSQRKSQGSGCLARRDIGLGAKQSSFCFVARLGPLCVELEPHEAVGTLHMRPDWSRPTAAVKHEEAPQAEPAQAALPHSRHLQPKIQRAATMFRKTTLNRVVCDVEAPCRVGTDWISELHLRAHACIHSDDDPVPISSRARHGTRSSPQSRATYEAAFGRVIALPLNEIFIKPPPRAGLDPLRTKETRRMGTSGSRARELACCAIPLSYMSACWANRAHEHTNVCRSITRAGTLYLDRAVRNTYRCQPAVVSLHVLLFMELATTGEGPCAAARPMRIRSSSSGSESCAPESNIGGAGVEGGAGMEGGAGGVLLDRDALAG
ncbi:hypothetical protein DFH06DRAFT_1152811 [Mycena polygramma]|nr:hypothetical protein DFH06DRAFT_1152811 [Mycena polygramma]